MNTTTSEKMRSLFKAQLESTPPETEGRRAGQKKLYYMSMRNESQDGSDRVVLVACDTIYDTELDSLDVDKFVRMYDAVPVFNVD